MNIQFVPFSSEIELPFYSALFSFKLDHDKLSDSSRPVLGLYEPRAQADPESSTKMQILGSALTSNQYVSHSVRLSRISSNTRESVPLGMTRAHGTIKNVNTVEDFKNTNKSAMITNAGRQVRYHWPSNLKIILLYLQSTFRYGMRSRTAQSTLCQPCYLHSSFSHSPTSRSIGLLIGSHSRHSTTRLNSSESVLLGISPQTRAPPLLKRLAHGDTL